jgi:hypothetical protein
MANRWLKLYAEIIDDVKLATIPDELKWRYITLLCLAADCDARGRLSMNGRRMTTAQIAWRLHLTGESSEIIANKLHKQMTELMEVGLIIQGEDTCYIIPTWQDRQGQATHEERLDQFIQSKRKQRNVSVDTTKTKDDSNKVSTLKYSIEENSIVKNRIKNIEGALHDLLRFLIDHTGISKLNEGQYRVLEQAFKGELVFDFPKAEKCYVTWCGLGWRENNLAWITEWYFKGIPDREKRNKLIEPKGYAGLREMAEEIKNNG